MYIKKFGAAFLGKELQCTREIENIYDLYAVKIVKPGIGTVGYLPKEISRPCHLFSRNIGALGVQLLGCANTLQIRRRVVMRYCTS